MSEAWRESRRAKLKTARIPIKIVPHVPQKKPGGSG